MLRMNKDNSEYEIDRELTWKFAIEKNAEYQDRIAELEEENKKLKSDLEWYQKHYWPKPLTTIEEVQNCKWNTIWM
jgi:cell shape-determining protein MreC